MSWSTSMIAASVALVALGVSIVMSTAPSEPAGVGSAPGAEAASPSAEASIIPAGDLTVAAVGTATYLGGGGDGGTEQITTDHITQNRAGESYALNRIEMSDPRLSGTLTNWGNSDDFGWPGTEGFEIYWGTYRIENDGGAWEGPYHGAVVWDVEDMGTPPPSFREVATDVDDWTWEAWLEGSGDYEGLSAWLRIDIDDMAFTSPVVAFIFPGPPPPNR